MGGSEETGNPIWFACAWMHLDASICVHMCAGVRACEWHLEGGQLFSSSPCFLRQGLSLNLKLAVSTRQAPGICLHLPATAVLGS